MDADNTHGLNDGSTVNIWGCVAGKSNQRFIPVSRGKDSAGDVVEQFKVAARPSKCLDVRENDGRLQIWTCGAAGKLNQEFALVGTGHGGDSCLLPMYDEILVVSPFGTTDGSAIYAGGINGTCDSNLQDTWLEN